MAYVFNKSTPPLLKDDRSILNIPTSALMSPVSTSTKQPNSPVINTDSQHDHWQTYSSYVIKRYQIWKITSASHHYDSDTKVTGTETTGYDEAKRNTFVQKLSVSAGASGFGMTASVMAELSLTEEDTQSWHSSETTTQEVTYKAGTTYVGWTLFEHIELTTTNRYQYEYKGDDPPGYSQTGTDTTIVEVAISNYDDAISDPDRMLAPSRAAVMARIN